MRNPLSNQLVCNPTIISMQITTNKGQVTMTPLPVGHTVGGKSSMFVFKNIYFENRQANSLGVRFGSFGISTHFRQGHRI